MDYRQSSIRTTMLLMDGNPCWKRWPQCTAESGLPRRRQAALVAGQRVIVLLPEGPGQQGGARRGSAPPDTARHLDHRKAVRCGKSAYQEAGPPFRGVPAANKASLAAQGEAARLDRSEMEISVPPARRGLAA